MPYFPSDTTLTRLLKLTGLMIVLLQPTFGLKAQSVSVGNGSYSTVLPPGALGPQNAQGVPISPLVTNDFTKPIQTNDFWSSLLFPFFGYPHSSNIFAHPLNLKATNTGLEIGSTSEPVFAGSDYLYPHSSLLRVGINGLNTEQTLAKGYGDWTFTAEWVMNDRNMQATAGHGLPFVFSGSMEATRS